MKKFRIVELLLLFFFSVCMILQARIADVPVMLKSSFFFLVIFWLYILVRAKGDRPEGFKTAELVEKLLLALLLWGLIMNLTSMPKSRIVIGLGLLVLTVFYLVNGVIMIFRKAEWFNGTERLFLAITLFGFLSRFMHWPTAFLMVISMGLWAIILFIYGFLIQVRFRRQGLEGLGAILDGVYFGLSAMMVFILFDSMWWKGSFMIFLVAIIITAITGLLKYFYLRNNPVSADDEQGSMMVKDTWRRILVYTLVGLFINAITVKQFISFKYGNYPELIEAEWDCKIRSRWNGDSDDCQKFYDLHEKLRNNKLQEKDTMSFAFTRFYR